MFLQKKSGYDEYLSLWELLYIRLS